ncbi:hypothetical protein GGQ73_003037 [Rhizobium skierniewicense]|uniref:Uncharacterized protein n=1 Tax=Rhizobium skierniewicense TaxID=984260 RepID=A0A7W6G2G8_9HYPH|nr:hypothetical protein [Rhizobium skierniewicense]MBB3947073.1 hypothetical protein [Rhizobium skierniewicense]
MADFDGHFPSVFGVDQRAMSPAAMWQLINARSGFFRDMPSFEGAKAFYDSISWMNPIILTACPSSSYQDVARQKRGWVREHLSTACHILPVIDGLNKPLFMHSPGDILIDDYKRNIAAWEHEGGVGLLHSQDFEATYQTLANHVHDYRNRTGRYSEAVPA